MKHDDRPMTTARTPQQDAPPVSTRRRKRLLVPSLVALIVALSACGTSQAVGTDAGGPGTTAHDHAGHDHSREGGPRRGAATATPSTVLDVTAKDHTYETTTDTLAAGPVTIRLKNEGVEPHQLMLARVPDGTTADAFIDSFERNGEASAFAGVEWAGGVNGTEPGATQEATANLTPGDYLMMCFIPTPGPNAVSHIVKKMVVPVKVVSSLTTSAAAPQTPRTIELRDFKIEVPQDITSGPVAVRNSGAENHELILMRFKPGKGAADLVAWKNAGAPADRPFEYAGGVGSIKPGTTAWANLQLPPGDYIALCVIQGAAHKAHVDLGMVSLFRVA